MASPKKQFFTLTLVLLFSISACSDASDNIKFIEPSASSSRLRLFCEAMRNIISDYAPFHIEPYISTKVQLKGSSVIADLSNIKVYTVTNYITAYIASDVTAPRMFIVKFSFAIPNLSFGGEINTTETTSARNYRSRGIFMANVQQTVFKGILTLSDNEDSVTLRRIHVSISMKGLEFEVVGLKLIHASTNELQTVLARDFIPNHQFHNGINEQLMGFFSHRLRGWTAKELTKWMDCVINKEFEKNFKENPRV